MTDGFYNNAVYWVEVDRITPNPFQPRKEFDEKALDDLADSIRQYGVLQPLTVTRREHTREDGGISVEYELVAGERRLRAAKRIGVQQVPVLIRSSEDSDKMKLEIAIIENLQREDLNPIDRAIAFKKLADDFKLKHTEIAQKMGKSREYVSNTLRLLNLPADMQSAIVAGKINEGHARPLLMLAERPQQQQELFYEIMERKLAVREAERISRRIATERARKQDLTPDLARIEKELTDELGTRVIIETKEKGGRLHIDFFSESDLEQLLAVLKHQEMQANEIVHQPTQSVTEDSESSPLDQFVATMDPKIDSADEEDTQQVAASVSVGADDTQDTTEPEDDLYSLKNFTV